MYDVAHATLIGTMSGHTSWVLGVTFSPDNEHFASSSSDGQVKVWEVATKQCLHTFTEHSDQVTGRFFSPLFIFSYPQVWSLKYNKEGNKLMSVSDDKTINVYSIPV